MSREKKNHRLGRCLRVEPEGLDVLTRNREIEEAFNKVVNTQEKEQRFEEVKDKLKLSKHEIARLKKRARRNAIERVKFKKMKAE